MIICPFGRNARRNSKKKSRRNIAAKATNASGSTHVNVTASLKRAIGSRRCVFNDSRKSAGSRSAVCRVLPRFDFLRSPLTPRRLTRELRTGTRDLAREKRNGRDGNGTHEYIRGLCRGYDIINSLSRYLFLVNPMHLLRATVLCFLLLSIRNSPAPGPFATSRRFFSYSTYGLLLFILVRP